jgi:hypothetical protein
MVTAASAVAPFTSPDVCVTVAGYGYNEGTGTARVCEIGMYSPGGDKNPCISCGGTGYTTAATQSTAATDCILAPGYYSLNNVPAPCPKGQYSLGGSFATVTSCTDCPSNTWTEKDELGTGLESCTTCRGGFGDWVAGVNGGNPSCTQCPINKWNPWGTRDSCDVCAAGTTSAKQSESQEECFDTWGGVATGDDYIEAAAFDTTTGAAAADKAACKALCTGNCVYYSFRDATTPKCQLVQATNSGANRLAFKTRTAVYTVWKTASDLLASSANLGAAITNVATPADCAKECDKVEECLAIYHAGTTCQLKTSAEWGYAQVVDQTQFRTVPEQLTTSPDDVWA